MTEQMQVWAHEYALEMAKQGVPLRSCVQLGWKYAEAMQAQAEQRRASEPDLDKPTIPPMSEFSKPQCSDDCKHDWQVVCKYSELHEVCSLCKAVRVGW